MSKQIQVKIQASDKDLPCDSKGKLCWCVDISVAGIIVACDVEVSDPLTSEQQDQSRWYLEQFLQQNPYENIKSSKHDGYCLCTLPAFWSSCSSKPSLKRESSRKQVQGRS
ncbi:hypothetical protein N7478_009144 [Penicillium angulare]|uniref:uncharacterized protein n=1 Tax=Penicillium angulare TaxID=116970 RepID=UPI00254108FD|nr:uncharacterized protein N7478_009144 [Penicillium angulare]KAJ5274019.1 hypothetical protein N7478_009144 [Penicillium angulare]